nr:TolC family protein [Ramlibacter montanisoli]
MRLLLLSCALALAGCATTQTPEALRADVDRLTEGRTGVAPAETGATLQSLLAKQPLDADSAVRIALLNSPGLDATLAALSISDAERVAAAQLPNPHFAFARLREGQVLEIERMVSFNVLSLATLPWRAQYANQSLQLARLRAAQEVIRTAADTRKAWFNAVAAQQTAAYLGDARKAAEAGAELARRMARVGNWSKLQQAREQAVLADISAQLARAQQAALSEREKLTRLMGLWGQDASYVLPERLPDLPERLAEQRDIEATALRERLDVRAARDEARYVAGSLGFTRATGFIDALTVGVVRNTSFDNAQGTRETQRGFELSCPFPSSTGARRARAAPRRPTCSRWRGCATSPCGRAARRASPGTAGARPTTWRSTIATRWCRCASSSSTKPSFATTACWPACGTCWAKPATTSPRSTTPSPRSAISGSPTPTCARR